MLDPNLPLVLGILEATAGLLLGKNQARCCTTVLQIARKYAKNNARIQHQFLKTGEHKAKAVARMKKNFAVSKSKGPEQALGRARQKTCIDFCLKPKSTSHSD